MATTKLKVINWKQEIDKAFAPIVKQQNALFVSHEREVAKKHLNITGSNKLWNEKYKPKFDKLALKEDMLYKKIWSKYHNNDGSVKAGYKIKI